LRFLAAGFSAAAVPGCVSSEAVEVLYAGSLNRAFEEELGPAFSGATGYGFRGEPRGSVALVNLVTGGQRSPDVVVSADSSLIVDDLVPDYADSCVEFATNSLVLAHRPGLEVESWFGPLLDSSVVVGMSDPDLDPLGYRAVMMLRLGRELTRESGLVPGRLEAYTQETELMAALETGEVDAAVVYRSMAVGHGVDFVELPPEVDFGHPEYAERYGSVSYTSEGGEVFSGRPIVYGAAALGEARHPSAARAFMDFLVSEEGLSLLRGSGLTVPKGLPREVEG